MPTLKEQVEQKAKELRRIDTDVDGWWLAKHVMASEIKSLIDLLYVIKNIPGKNLYMEDVFKSLKDQLSALEKL